ncbi:MAG: hypothetical protein GY859_09820 [Desulfobacterales bacterium]|nr:hypothetical protein [Desulfobacterales bacterium]
MEYWIKEKIGPPELFTGRKKELVWFLNWIQKIKLEMSQSAALLSRRKTGKTALMQRLYNITFHKNDIVIPFYFEIKETKQWFVDFSVQYFLTFIYQYIAFKTRKREYISYSKVSFSKALKTARKESLDYLVDIIEDVEQAKKKEYFDILWDMARDAPRTIAEYNDERVIQMIDEFQFINRYIFRDKACKNRMSDLAGSYLHTCEYKNAPMLVSGSWVGWLMDDLNRYLPGRFVKKPLGGLPEGERVEMIFKYALLGNTPVTEDTAWLIANLTEGNPAYINALFHSGLEGKDLGAEEGVRRILEYETLHPDGSINATWMDYIDSAFSRINDKYAKSIVLYLCKYRDRKVGRTELKQKLKIEMSDRELEKRLKALYRADIIEADQGFYRGVRDNIFDKVFRMSNADDIDKFVTEEAPDEYKALFESILKKFKRLSGEYNRFKGAFAEFMIFSHLGSAAFRNSERFKSMMNNLPEDFEFVEYDRIWSYTTPPLHEPEFQVDLFARAGKGGYSLIGEVKNREAKFSVKEARHFMEKVEELKKLEQVGESVSCVFSLGGFFKNTMDFFRKNGIAWSADSRWINKLAPPKP